MAMTILVTGGTGYIGAEVIDLLLARGHSVHTTVRDALKSEPRLRARWPEARYPPAGRRRWGSGGGEAAAVAVADRTISAKLS